MKRLAMAALLSMVLTAPAFAAEGGGQPGPKFEERKAQILKFIDTRISILQEEKDCIQASKNGKEIEACTAKREAKMKRLIEQEEIWQQHGK